SGWGSWAGYAVAEAAACYPLLPGMRNEDAAGMIVNPLTALAMFDIVREEGEKSFILTAGASQLSKLMISAARDEGFRPIAVVRRPCRQRDVSRLRATHGGALPRGGAAHPARRGDGSAGLGHIQRDGTKCLLDHLWPARSC